MTLSNQRLAWFALATLTVAALAGAATITRQAAPKGNTDSAPGRTARRQRFGEMAVVGRTVTIHRSRDDVYRFCRDISNVSRLLEHIADVTAQNGDVTRCVIKAPAGMTFIADIQIVTDRPGEEISWASVETSRLETRGKVLFRDAPADRGTEVEATTAYRPPLGELGRIVTNLFGEDPAVQTRHALKRLKMLMETGEIATAQHRRAVQ